MVLGQSSLAGLPLLRPGVKRQRASSYDRLGGNSDWVEFAPGETRDIFDVTGPGCIKHIWMTLFSNTRYEYRNVIVRMWWDDETEPSVEVPIGDFFGLGHGLAKNFISLPLQMSPQDGRAFNCWFAMPFDRRARIAITNECTKTLNFYFYIDYETYQTATDMSAYGRFHAQWRRVNPTPGWADPSIRWEDHPDKMRETWKTPNLDGAHNYIILEAQGAGHYVGCHVDIDVFTRQANDWYGEGDDMIFIDDEPLPRLYGTGTEDYFNTAFCPKQEYHAPYHGVILYQGTGDWQWRGKNTVYRYHIEDPIYFEKSVRVTIEHGHANKLTLDYASTAYWYQTEPHLPFPALLDVAGRQPRL